MDDRRYVAEELQATIWGLEHQDPLSPYEHGDLARARWITRVHETADNALQTLARRPNKSHRLCTGFDNLDPKAQEFLKRAFRAALHFFDIEAASQIGGIRQYLSTSGDRDVYFKMRHFAYFQAAGTDEDRQNAQHYLQQVDSTLHLEFLYALQELVDPVFPHGSPRPMTVTERVNRHVMDAFLHDAAYNPHDARKASEVIALRRWIDSHTDPIAAILDDPPDENIQRRTIAACWYLDHQVLGYNAMRYLMGRLRQRYRWA